MWTDKLISLFEKNFPLYLEELKIIKGLDISAQIRKANGTQFAFIKKSVYKRLCKLERVIRQTYTAEVDENYVYNEMSPLYRYGHLEYLIDKIEEKRKEASTHELPLSQPNFIVFNRKGDAPVSFITKPIQPPKEEKVIITPIKLEKSGPQGGPAGS